MARPSNVSGPPLEHILPPLRSPQGQGPRAEPRLPGIAQILGTSRKSNAQSYDQEDFFTSCSGRSIHESELVSVDKYTRSKPLNWMRIDSGYHSTLHLSRPLRPKDTIISSLFSDEQTDSSLEQWNEQHPYVPRSPPSSFPIGRLKIYPQQPPLTGHVETIVRDNDKVYEGVWSNDATYAIQSHEQKKLEMEIIHSTESVCKGLDCLDRSIPGSRTWRKHTVHTCVDCQADNFGESNADYNSAWCGSERRDLEKMSTPTSKMIGAHRSSIRKDDAFNSNVPVDFRSTCKRIGNVLEILDTEFAKAGGTLWRTLVTRCKTSTNNPIPCYAKQESAYVDIVDTVQTSCLLPRRNLPVPQSRETMTSWVLEPVNTRFRDAMANMLQYGAHMMLARVVYHHFLPPADVKFCIFTAHSHALQLLAAFRDIGSTLRNIVDTDGSLSDLLSSLILDLATLAFDTIGAGGLVLEIAAISQAMGETLKVLTSIPSLCENRDGQIKMVRERFALVQSAVPNTGDLVPYKACWKIGQPMDPDSDFREDVMYGVSYATFFTALIESRLGNQEYGLQLISSH